MDVTLLENRRFDSEGSGARFNITLSRLDRFLHHIAELAGSRDPSLAGHHHGLDRQQFAADLSPSQARGYAHQVLGLGLAEPEPADPGVFIEVAPRHGY